MADLLDRLQSELTGYRIERELGGGGMSRVFLAEESALARKVVIKVLPPELGAGVNAERFRREIQLAAALQHPHIVPVLAAGQAGELFYYTMPFIPGDSLRAKLAREGELPVPEAVRILRDVADALAYAHEQGVVHRDIKPDNVLISGKHAVVTDFGVAKAISASTGPSSLTSAGVALGTPAYMSPEQAAADPHTDHRADVYALGAMAYEMLTGQPPFHGMAPQQMLAAHVTEAPVPITNRRATVPPALAETVMRCLQKKAADRWQNAEDLRAQLELLATPSGGMTPTSATPGVRTESARSATGWRRIVAIAAVATVVLGGALAAGLAARNRPRIIASAARIAIIPLVPTTDDTALARLGRDLVVTLSANLEGVGDIRTVDALTVLAQPRAVSAVDAAELARRLGASSFVHGSLVRLGTSVRLDLALFPTDSGAPIARASVTASPDDLNALTDSTTWALLRQVWRARQPPTPNVAAVTTHSIPALRAFLEGEQAIARAQFLSAGEAFARAIAADSTFWLAYQRYVYSRGWLAVPVDSALRAKLRAHAAELPEKERLLYQRESRLVTQRFPDYWPGWMQLGDGMVHDFAGFQGGLPADAIAALDRVVELNPSFLPGWEHLQWIALVAQDTGKARAAYDALVRLRFKPTDYGFDAMLAARYWMLLVERGGEPEPARADSLARSISGVSIGNFQAVVTSALGYHRAQIDLNRRGLRHGNSRLMAEAFQQFTPYSWAGRGAWDSALAAMDRYAAAFPGPSSALAAYGLALTGASVGTVPSEQVARRRTLAEQVVTSAGPAERMSLAWLDGFGAFVRADRDSLARARATVARSNARGSANLAATLGALEMALAGRRREAADTLAAMTRLEEGFALLPTARFTVRFAAAGWLLASGDTARADSLLRSALTLSGPNRMPGEIALAPHAILLMARLAAARGQHERAASHYRQFLIRYDMPPPAHRPWVDSARLALARYE